MRERLPSESEEIRKTIKEAAESVPDEDEPGGDIPEGAPEVTDEEIEKARGAAQKRMNEENPER